MFRDFGACEFAQLAGLSPAAPSQDPIVEHAATLPRQRHAVKSKFLGFYRLQKRLHLERFSREMQAYGNPEPAMKLEGGCYCGALRYLAEGEPMLKAQCHCECQYITAARPTCSC
jgi:hypothetical protein